MFSLNDCLPCLFLLLFLDFFHIFQGVFPYIILPFHTFLFLLSYVLSLPPFSSFFLMFSPYILSLLCPSLFFSSYLFSSSSFPLLFSFLHSSLISLLSPLFCSVLLFVGYGKSYAGNRLRSGVHLLLLTKRTDVCRPFLQR